MKFLMLIVVFTTLPFTPIRTTPKKFGYKAERLVGTTTARAKKLEAALELFAQVMNDSAFQKALRKKKFIPDRTDDPNRGLTTAAVVNKLFFGKERYTQRADSIANIYWEVAIKSKPANDPTPTIGYTNSGGKIIYTYSWIIDTYSVADITGHIAHEWAHKLGFVHRRKYHNARKETVPYAYGYLVRRHAARLKGIDISDKEEGDFQCGEMNTKQ